MDIQTIFYLLKVSVSLFLFHAVYYFFLRRLTFHNLNRYFLIISVLLSFILPLAPHLITIPQQIYERVLPIVEITGDTSTYVMQAEKFSFSKAFIFLWLFIGIALFIRSLVLISRVLLIAQQSENQDWNSYSIRYNDKIVSPFSFLNKIYLPSKMNECSYSKRLILEHECIHIAEGHSFDKIFFELISCILWFHPSIYLMKTELESQHEFYVDRKIIEKAGHKKKESYGQLLLNSLSTNNQPILINTFYNSLIKNRIHMMTRNKHQKSFLKNYLTVLMAASILLLMWSCNTDSSTDQDTSHLKRAYTEMEVHDIVETMPEFIGGEDALLKFIYQAIEYPAVSRENDIQGLAVSQFIVEPDGSISNIEMLRELDDATSEEVLRVVKTMPNWKAGMKGGENVRVSYKLPVRFKLQ